MGYATLMVHLELGRPNAGLLKIAGDLADRLHAGVIGVAVCQPMRIIYNDGYIPGELIEQDRQQLDTEIKAAETEFHSAFGSSSQVCEWRSVITYTALSAQLAKEARCADLVITGVDRNASLFDTSHHVDIGDFVMQVGRPCLIVPTGTEKLALDHVVIGWKETGETRRAVRDSLALLRLAERVSVVEIAVEEDLADADSRVRDVAGWLKLHGVEATPVTRLSTGDDVELLNKVLDELGADLLVAGAYGHSRLREWVLGGVTRDLLLRATRVSLVSH